MRHLTGVIVFAAFAFCAPLHAEECTGTNCPPQDKAHTISGATKTAGMGGSTAAPATAAGSTAAPGDTKPKVKKAEKPKKPKPTAGDGTSAFDGAAADNQPKSKRATSAPVRHSSTVPVVREGGKTCSGQDEYRVCW